MAIFHGDSPAMVRDVPAPKPPPWPIFQWKDPPWRQPGGRWSWDSSTATACYVYIYIHNYVYIYMYIYLFESSYVFMTCLYI